MTVSRFYAVNVASALARLHRYHIIAVTLVGATFSILGATAKPLAILLVVLFVMGWAGSHIVRWTLRRGIPYFIDALGRLRCWAGTHDTWLSSEVSPIYSIASRPSTDSRIIGCASSSAQHLALLWHS